MKHEGTLVLSLVISFIVRGVAVSATLRSAASSEDVQSASFEAGTFPGDSFLDVSESSESAAAERRVLLDRLSKAEALTATERQALQAQQHVLVALEKEQRSQESTLSTLEAAERSSRLVMDKGTMRNVADRAAIERQPAHQFHKPQNYEVASKLAMKKHEHHKKGTASKTEHAEFVVLVHGTEEELWDRYNKAFWEKIVGIVIYIVQIFIAAFLYMQFCKQSVTPKLPESQVRVEEFQYGAFDLNDCARDCQMCFCACCCPWIRWAETASKEHVQFLAFIPALFIAALLASAGSVTFGASIPILLIILVLCRQRIRDAYALPSGTCSILFSDCLLWLCCPCCAIVQEARQVEYVEPPLLEYSNPLMGP